MVDQDLTYPAIVYLAPDVSEYLSFASWKMTRKECLLVNPIPKTVYNWIKPGNLTLLEKLKKNMHPLLLRRYAIICSKLKT